MDELESLEADPMCVTHAEVESTRRRILSTINKVLRDHKIQDIVSEFLIQSQGSTVTEGYKQVNENITIAEAKKLLKLVENRLAIESGNARVEMWALLDNDLAAYKNAKKEPVEKSEKPAEKTEGKDETVSKKKSTESQHHEEEKGFHAWNWFWYGKGVVEKKDPNARFWKNLGLSAKEELLAALSLAWEKFTGGSKMVFLGARYVLPIHKLFWKKSIPYIARKLTIFEDDFWMKGGKGGSSNSSSGHH